MTETEYRCPDDGCGWTGSRRPTGGVCPECLFGNDERVAVVERPVEPLSGPSWWTETHPERTR